MKRATRFIFILLTFGCGLTATRSQEQTLDLRFLLPSESLLKGWPPADTARVYAGEDLFSLIDGGAVLFFEYGFDRAVAIEYTHGSGSSINLEIYRMKDAGAGFGIYSARSGGEGHAVAIGQEGTRHKDYVMFWKGDYYVTVTSSDTTAQCSATVDRIAQSVDRAIKKTGVRPRGVDFLPEAGLRKARYFRGGLGMGALPPLEPEDAAGIVDGVSGMYERGSVVILRYPNEDDAREHTRRLRKVIQVRAHDTGGQDNEGIATVHFSDGRVCCLGQSGASIVLAISPEELTAVSSVRRTIGSLNLR